MRKRENVYLEFSKSSPAGLEMDYKRESTTGEMLGAIFFSLKGFCFGLNDLKRQMAGEKTEL